MHRAAPLLLSIALLSCGGASHAGRSTGTWPVQGNPSPQLTLGADTVRVLPDGERTFQEILRIVRSASREIDVEMYEFGRLDLQVALVAAHQRGVDVQVIVDPTVDVSAVTEGKLRAAGVAVAEYPVRPRMIDHVKLLVVDGGTAIVGGINWGQASAANHDFDCEVTGPVARNLFRVFRRDIITAGAPARVPDAQTDTSVEVLTTLPAIDIGQAAISLIRSAHHEIDLDLFELSSAAVINALESAHARGVAIRLLLDPSQRPSDGPASQLEAAGIAVRRYRTRGELLHAKVIVVDSRDVLFGSANWSAGGFARNHEVDLEFDDNPAVAAAFLAQMRADWDASN